ncbi:MAG: TonB-dependent receptor, partial [Rhodothermales bacterium]|nr:TonB-dependent receptor [Rhodothermales bacterium]
ATEADGTYALRLPVGRYALRVTAVGYAPVVDSVTVRKDATTTYDVALAVSEFELGTVEVEEEGATGEAGVYTLDPKDVQSIPSPFRSDALRAVKVLPGVTSNNETSYQYSVRGGGYNENLYYVDGFELWTPFRTRQGEQEGLGLVNPDLSDRITLYAGGFPARYGGKLSSALDVAYARPRQGVSGAAFVSALDAGGALRAAPFGGRLGVAVAGRAARARGFFGTQELKGEYDPEFNDVQGTLTYRIADGHEVQGLGLWLSHRFRLEPTRRRTFFGTFDDLRSVSFGYTGEEEDGYDMGFGGVRLVNRFGRVQVSHEASVFDVEEYETYDISGSVALFAIDNPFEDPDDPANLLQTGAAFQQDVADNRVRVTTATGAGRYNLALGRHVAEAGWTVRRLRFEDDLFEASFVAGKDTLGQPVRVALDSLAGAATFSEWQTGLYVQDAVDVLPEPGRLVITGGLRADYFTFNEEWTLSPRLSASFVLDDRTTFSAAGGLYHQAPTYRELRGEPVAAEGGGLVLGALNRDLRSQRALQFVAGVERFFPKVRFWGRAEAYYKQLDHLISYTVENVRTVYSGVNDAEGYVYGFDLQLRGEFVPGLESWLNYGFMVAEEEFLPAYTDLVNASGFVPRPTDRRHNVSLFVQDYVPGSRQWKLHLRALFGTGTPYT